MDGQIIALSDGEHFARVDELDFDSLGRYRWHFHEGYACRNFKGRRIRMHREIMNCPTGMVIDHVNGDGLDNRRLNLRVCTQSGNMRNRRKNANGITSQFKGVSRRAGKINKPWVAAIMIDGRVKYLGIYNSEIDAAIAYDTAAHTAFGEFARLNFPNGVSRCSP